MNVLDTKAGKGAWGCWLGCTEAWQQESAVLGFPGKRSQVSQERGQGVEVNQLGWNMCVVL